MRFQQWNVFQKNLSVKVFVAILLLIVLPWYCVAMFSRYQYELYFREEISQNIIASFAQNEQDVEDAFSGLSNLAYIFCLNTELKQALSDDSLSYYEKMLVFDDLVEEISLINITTTYQPQITMVDAQGYVYSNWTLNFNDYSFLESQEWMRESFENSAVISWGFFVEPYIQEDAKENKYVGLARGIMEDNTYERLATIVITIRQSEFSKILQNYLYQPEDMVVVSSAQADILMCEGGTDESLEATTQFLIECITQEITLESVQEISGKEYLVTSYDISESWIAGHETLTIYYFTSYDMVANRVDEIGRMMTLMLLTGLAIMSVVAHAIARSFVKPVKTLSQTMVQYDLTKQYVLPDSKRSDEIGLLNQSFLKMEADIKRLFARAEKESKEKEQYQLDFLRAQLNPHFLFNTLNMIRWMALVQKMNNIVESIDALGSMLNYSMKKGEPFVTLREELDNLRGYVKIQNYRYGNQIVVESSIPPELETYRLMRFILQPVVENALLHAFEKTDSIGTIQIHAHCEDNTLVIRVIDDGTGIPLEKLEELNGLLHANNKNEAWYAETFNGIGLVNVSRQIQMNYGSAYGLSFLSDGTNGTEVRYTLPILVQEDTVHEEDNDCG